MTYRFLLRRLPQFSAARLPGTVSSIDRVAPVATMHNHSFSNVHLMRQTRSYRTTLVILDEEEKKPLDKKALKQAAKEKMAAAAAAKEKAEAAPKEESPEAEEEPPPLAPDQEETKAEPVSGSCATGQRVVPQGGGDTGEDFVIPKYADRPADTPDYQNPLHHNNPDMQKIFAEDFEEGEEMPILPLPPMDGRSPPHIEKLADDILHLNMLEYHELVKMIQEHFGWKDDDLRGSMMGGGGGGGAAAVEVEEEVVVEKTTFDLRLEGFDAKAKIKVIKEVRAIAGLGLKEAKELVEGAPKVIKKDLKKEEAEELKAKLEELGAVIEVV